MKTDNSHISAISASSYLDELIVPLSIIAGALVIGILVERLLIRFIYRAFEKRDWKIGRRIIGSFNGIVTVWFGLAAFRSVLHDFPMKASALPLTEHIASAIFIVSIATLIARIGVAFIRTFSSRHERAAPSVTLIENIVRSAIFLVGLLAIFRAFGVAITPLLTALGVGGLAVALALQDTLSNFFAGIYIILSKHLDPGDYIKLDSGQEGIIRDIAWRVTTIQTPLNTLIIVPNSKFSTSIITNFDRPDTSMNLAIELPLDSSTDPATFEQRAFHAVQETSQLLADAIEGSPVLHYTAITPANATLQLLIRINDFTRGAEIKSEILKRIYKETHPASPKALQPDIPDREP
ncbi:MAG TPA: mechanosensitive ion channel domain-containing protein [Candidatus Kapabacteria bacterium]|jgi:small-conductance mechanosensitive channel|nr:mechanosensitive ion channel domain-containing protein [Candidatus Kapabacteria bacterium]